MLSFIKKSLEVQESIKVHSLPFRFSVVLYESRLNGKLKVRVFPYEDDPKPFYTMIEPYSNIVQVINCHEFNFESL